MSRRHRLISNASDFAGLSKFGSHGHLHVEGVGPSSVHYTDDFGDSSVAVLDQIASKAPMMMGFCEYPGPHPPVLRP